ncbi:MAG TPA: hypothetical protein VEG64_03825 [Candidatus Sulfotelmatobacter sp.]|nr:hypothetical protein [Candidatus Sulfotelmatobacter sp.]
MRNHLICVAAAILWFPMPVLAQTAGTAPAPAKPKADAPASMPRDEHDGLSIAVDPYADPQRAKEKFGKANPVDIGVLPLEVIIRNDTDHPIRLNLATVQLEVRLKNGGRQDIGWLSAEEVASAIAHPSGSVNPSARRLPPVGIPLPTKDKKTEKLAEILRPLTLDSDVVAPRGTIHGFLYFNLNRDMSLAPAASLYVPDAAIVPSNKPLMFFEVPLSTSPPQPEGTANP